MAGTLKPSESTPRTRRDADGAVDIVIVPIDFSEPSLAALGLAESLAASSAPRIRLLHAVAPSPLEEVSGAQQSLVDAAYARLEELASPIRRRGVLVDCVATVSTPIELIEQAVRAVEMEGERALVAMGDHGQSALRRAILGSVADAVLRRIELPVVIAHAGESPSECMQVVVAYGFDRESDEAVDVFVALFGARAASIDVEVVHALPELDWTEGTDAPLLRSAFADEVERRRGTEVASVVERLRMRGFDARSSVVRGDPARAVLVRAGVRHADLIVAGRRHRRVLERILLGSTAEGIVHRARCAVLTAGLRRVATPATKAVIVT